MVLRKSFYIRWSAGRSPRVHEVNPGRDPSLFIHTYSYLYYRVHSYSIYHLLCAFVYFHYFSRVHILIFISSYTVLLVLVTVYTFIT